MKHAVEHGSCSRDWQCAAEARGLRFAPAVVICPRPGLCRGDVLAMLRAFLPTGPDPPNPLRAFSRVSEVIAVVWHKVLAVCAKAKHVWLHGFEVMSKMQVMSPAAPLRRRCSSYGACRLSPCWVLKKACIQKINHRNALKQNAWQACYC